MNISLAQLTAQVHANNVAAEYANILAPLLVARYKPLIGRKFYKKDGSLTQHAQDLRPNASPARIDWHFARLDYGNQVLVCLRTHERIEGKESCVYSRNGDFVLGTVAEDKQTLLTVELPPAKLRIHLDAVLAADRGVEAASDTLNAALIKLRKFNVLSV